LNGWIAILFALGALLFSLGSVLSLAPALARACSLSSTGVNAVYFVGSIPFTMAAYLQLFQAANAPQLSGSKVSSAGSRRKIFGWRPQDIGWLSSALQFAGTILFNINTLDVMHPSPNWIYQDLEIWAPDVIGSVLFLASGCLAFMETCHAYWAWRPSSVSWWVTLVNLAGCIGFMIAALFALVLPDAPNMEAMTVAAAFTLQGAVCFFVGSGLSLIESGQSAVQA
jgi:hypothetical protein